MFSCLEAQPPILHNLFLIRKTSFQICHLKDHLNQQQTVCGVISVVRQVLTVVSTYISATPLCLCSYSLAGISLGVLGGGSCSSWPWFSG